MATFKIETTDVRDETVEADYVEFVNGHFQFKVWDSNLQSQVNVFIIREAYVRTVRKES